MTAAALIAVNGKSIVVALAVVTIALCRVLRPLRWLSQRSWVRRG